MYDCSLAVAVAAATALPQLFTSSRCRVAWGLSASAFINIILLTYKNHFINYKMLTFKWWFSNECRIISKKSIPWMDWLYCRFACRLCYADDCAGCWLTINPFAREFKLSTVLSFKVWRTLWRRNRRRAAACFSWLRNGTGMGSVCDCQWFVSPTSHDCCWSKRSRIIEKSSRLNRQSIPFQSGQTTPLNLVLSVVNGNYPLFGISR